MGCAETTRMPQGPERGLSQTAARRQPDRRSNHPDHLSSTPALRVGTTRAPTEFTNEEIYTYAPELEALHPDNRHPADAGTKSANNPATAGSSATPNY